MKHTSQVGENALFFGYYSVYILGAQLVHFCKKNKKQVHFFLLFVYIGVKIVLCFYKVLLRKAQSLTPTIGFFQKIRIIYIERENKMY